MTSWAANLMRRDRTFALMFLIQGVGAGGSPPNSDGRYRWCSTVPDHASGSNWYRPYLQAPLPDVLSERGAWLGGVGESGSVTFELLDYQDFLTSTLRLDRPPTTALDGAISDTATSVDVLDATDISQDDVVWVGGEAMNVTNIVSDTLTVTRGYLDTVARPHSDRDRVFLSTPGLKGRQVDLKASPIDSDAYADERLIWSGVLDDPEWSEDGNTWILSAESLIRNVNRVIPRSGSSVTYEILGADNDRGTVFMEALDTDASTVAPSPLFSSYSDNVWFRNGDEIIRADGGRVTTAGVNKVTWRASERGALGTEIEDLKSENKIRRVLVADGDMRFSPGPTPSENRASGTWTGAVHWLDLLFCILLSSNNSDDGLELTNYNASAGLLRDNNYSGLPVGYGVGAPESEVDWDAAEEVAQRTPDFLFPFFAYGDEPVEFGELIAHHFLRPIGAFFTASRGSARVTLPREVLGSAATFTIGAGDILTKPLGRRTYLPRIKPSGASSEEAARITMVVGPREVRRELNDTQYGDLFAQSGLYGADLPEIKIPVPSADPQASEWLERRIVGQLRRSHRPRVGLMVDVDFVHWDVEIGDIGTMTLPEMPNLRQATRGWTTAAIQLLEREERFGDGDGAYLALRVEAFPSARSGRICPAGHVSSVASNTATLTQNRFTESDAVGGLPTTDAAAFTVGDVVRLIDADGTDAASGATETVQSISSNDVALSGNFSGNLAAGTFLIYAHYDAATAAQQASYAFQSDQTGQTVDSSTVAPFEYAGI